MKHITDMEHRLEFVRFAIADNYENSIYLAYYKREEKKLLEDIEIAKAPTKQRCNIHIMRKIRLEALK